MSYIDLLSHTYDHLYNLQDGPAPGLLPLAHSTVKAHVEVRINSWGEFVSASFIPNEVKEDGMKFKGLSETIIPVTDDSLSRSSGSAPHPVFDKLKYVASNYSTYTGENNSEFFESYIENLRAFAESPYGPDSVKAILYYLEHSDIIADLVEADIFSLDEHGLLTTKFEKASVKLAEGKQYDAFIRFAVDDESRPDIWNTKEFQDAYVQYYLSSPKNKGLCYITGEEVPLMDKHPRFIRYGGDTAKLISSNDNRNYTYLGRFRQAADAFQIGCESSLKAHNCLKYLIQHQGERFGDKVFVLWGTSEELLPDINCDTLDLIHDRYNEMGDIPTDGSMKAFADRLYKAMYGYRANLNFDSKVALLGVDSATPGRLAVIYYREYFGQMGHDLIDRIEKWHSDLMWYHRYKNFSSDVKGFWGAPALFDIVTCAYGTERSEKGGSYIKCDERLCATELERLLPCISDGARIPKDIVMRLYHRACMPQNYKESYNWNKVFSICCSLYRKYLIDYEKEVIDLDHKSDDLAYKLGQLLAVADRIESYALYFSDTKDGGSGKGLRQTNAMRYFTRFVHCPNETWEILRKKLLPYQRKLGKKGDYLNSLMAEISSQIDPEAFKTARHLDGKFALGFDSMRYELFNNAKAVVFNENVIEE